MNLLIFDECHRVTKKDPSNLIMQEFYHPANQARVSPNCFTILISSLESGASSRSQHEGLPGLFSAGRLCMRRVTIQAHSACSKCPPSTRLSA